MDVSSGRVSVRICKKCGREFFDPRGARAMCFECHRRKKKPTFTEEKACAVCGKGFIPRSANHAFCSEGCFAMRFGTATCPTCGKEFVRVRKGQMHCSNECAIETRHEASKRPCPICGKTLSYRDDRKNMYCSKECMYRAHGTIRTCLQCGREFHAVKTNQGKGKYCSPECSQKAQRTRADCTCIQCGRVFHPHSMAKGLYCSRQCSGIALRTNACAVCGKWVPSGTAYCSPECKGAKDAWVRIGYEKQFDDMVGWMGWLSKTLPRRCDLCGEDYCPEAINQKRCRSCAKYLKDNHGDLRLWRNGRPDMSITLWKVYQRDKGYCRGCGRHLEFVEDYNSDVYPSIDHIVPLAKGGLHRWDNVQLMCRACNSIKCDDMPEVRERSFQTRLTIDDDWMAGWLDGCI